MQHRELNRLLVWKVRDSAATLLAVISTVYGPTDLGVTVLAVKFQTGPISRDYARELRREGK